MRKLSLLLFLSIFTYISVIAQKIPFQGYYEEADFPITGTRDINFEIARFSWTELHTAVTIDKGLYSIVLGSITPLPDSIFSQTDFEDVVISVGGTSIGTFQIYSPVTGNTSTQNGGSVQVNNLAGNLRADLNYFAPNDAGSLVIYGANDSTKAILGTSTGGYNGALFLYDSLRNSNVSLRGNNNGGGLQLSYREAGLLRSAVSTGASTYGSYMNLYGANPAIDGVSLMIENYITANQIQNGPLMSGNYRRSGTDWKDNNGQILAAIGNSRDETGADPTGHSGFLSLWGTNSFNGHFTGKRWENNDFPLLELFGNNDDGGTFWMSNVVLEVSAGLGTDNLASFRLSNTDNGGISTIGANITSNLGSTGAGGIELYQANSQRSILLDGSSGFVEATSGAHLGDFFDNSIRLSGGSFQMYGGGTGGASDNGRVTTEFSDFGFNGRLYLKGDNGAGANIDRVVLEATPDGGGSSYGRFTLYDGTGAVTITAEGINGNINSSGTITAVTVTQTSDLRYKSNIEDLEGSLSGINQLRGVSYYWKDANKGNTRQIGVIAQEIEEIYPEFVYTNSEGFKSVNYAQLTAVLIEAVKELNAKVGHLESENDGLKASLEETNELRSRMERIEQLLLIQSDTQSK